MYEHKFVKVKLSKTDKRKIYIDYFSMDLESHYIWSFQPNHLMLLPLVSLFIPQLGLVPSSTMSFFGLAAP